MPTGKLFLIPAPLAEGDISLVLPEGTRRQITHISHFVVEQSKTARQYLKQLALDNPLQSLQLSELNEHTKADELEALLAPALAGHDLGLLSEAGCPAIADPGANLVRLAHERGVRVLPLVGPSSILLALMASGSNGQRFSFHGYLPIDAAQRTKKLQDLEKRSAQFDEAIAFIEAPYRNNQMLEAALAACRKETLLCVACDLTDEQETIISRNVGAWPSKRPDFHKRPCMFVMYAGPR